MANQITVTWAGDTQGLQKSFRETEDAAQKSGKAVGEAWDQNIEKADTLDTRAMGFRDTLTGLQDGAAGVKKAASGDWGFETLLLLGFGIGDLASGMVNLVLPALKATKIATLAQAAATNIASVATKGFTIAQNFLKIAFLTSPIGWIVLAIGALVAIVVLIATKTTWFQTLWRVAWSGIKAAASNTWDFLKKIPGWIQTAFGKVAGFIIAPYKFAFNQIARLWNGTVGGLSFTVPGWIPGIGGNSFSVPHIPTFHSGGVVPGARGTLQPIMALGGERMSGLTGGSQMTVAAGDALTALIFKIVKDEVTARGGDPSSIGLAL
jgi:hypothetical protein